MTAERSAAANNTAQEPADAAADMGLVRLAHAACPELFIDTGGAILNPLNALSIFDDDNTFNEYLNVLSAMSVADQTLATRRLQRNMCLKMMQYDSFFSAGHFSLAMTESAPGRALRSAASAVGMVFPSVAPGLDRIQ